MCAHGTSQIKLRLTFEGIEQRCNAWKPACIFGIQQNRQNTGGSQPESLSRAAAFLFVHEKQIGPQLCGKRNGCAFTWIELRPGIELSEGLSWRQQMNPWGEKSIDGSEGNAAPR
jgi:hypothetical protein